MTMKNGFWVGLVLGSMVSIGCGAAVMVIPPAHAQSTQRWEYLTIEHGWDGGRWANEAGREGWEFVDFDPRALAMIFKRPAP